MPDIVEEMLGEYQNCGICGERFTVVSIEFGQVAEMYDPRRPQDDSKVVHADCGLASGWEIA